MAIGVIGLLSLSLGCLSYARLLPNDTPRAANPATDTPAAEEPVPASTNLPGAESTPITQATLPLPSGPTPQQSSSNEKATATEAGACPSRTGRMSVSSLDSTILSVKVLFSLYLPPCYDARSSRPYPVLYLLHGVSADHTQWPDLNVQQDADLLIDEGVISALVVVMPGGDYREGYDYGAFVLQELIPHVEGTLRVATRRQDRAIGGLSQGGFWALQVGLAHPDRFEAIGGHSPATGPGLAELLSLNPLAELKTLRIYLDVGNQDPLASGVTVFAGVLRTHGLAATFHIYPGAHNRPYWRSHTEEYLAFYAARGLFGESQP